MSQSIGEIDDFIDISGSPMRVVQSGRGDTLMLAHSYLWDSRMWRAQIKELSKHYRVLVPNLWGHGGSGPLPQGTHSLRDIALHHLELIDSLDVSQFSLVGHSVGGMWGAELALLVPERVQSFVLVDTSLQPEPEMTRKRYFAMLDAIQAAGVVPGGMVQEIAEMFFSPSISSWAPELVWSFRVRLANWEVARLIDSVVPLGRMTFDRRETLTALSQCSMPKLVIHGADDTPRPVDEGRRMSEVLGVRFIEVPGAGHMAPLEAPHDVTRHLLNFLSEVHRTSKPLGVRNAGDASPVGAGE